MRRYSFPKIDLHLHLDGLLATLATKALPTQMIKTDRVTGEALTQRAETYRPQLAAYAAALEKILEKPVAERILYFFAAGTEISL